MDEKELLKLAGKLSSAAREVVYSNVLTLSSKIVKLEFAMNEYDNAIMDIAKQNNSVD